MPSKPPLTRNEVYDLIHDLWVRAARERGADEYSENTLKAVRVSLFMLSAALLKKTDDDATAQTEL
jgi:hypothetical protein